MSNLVYFKIDTTGTDVAADRVLSISALKVTQEGRSAFNRYILPRGEWNIPEEVTAINGLTEEFIRENGEDPVVVFEDFNKFINAENGNDLVTFNGLNFDVRFLNLAYLRYGMRFDATFHRMFDMYEIEARNNANDFASTYRRHVGIDKNTVLKEEPKKTVENLERLFWKMSEDYTADEILGKFKPTILDLENIYRMDNSGNLVFVRGKHSGKTVYETIQKDPDYIFFLFKSIVSPQSKQIIINDYEKRKKSTDIEPVPETLENQR